MCDLFIARNRMLLDAGISHRLDNSGPDLHRAGDQSDFPAPDNVGEYGGDWRGLISVDPFFDFDKLFMQWS